MTELTTNKRQVFISYATKSWIKKGLMLHYLDRYEEALQAYDKSLELNPDAFVVWYNKGIALTDLGRDREVLQAYDRALELNPDEVF